MPRTYTKKPKPYTEDDLKEALTLIKQGKLSIIAASNKFRIDKSKLCRTIHQKNISKRGRKQTLSNEQETDLAEKIKIMAKWGFALSKQEIQSVVQTYVNENAIKTTFKDGKPGDDWFRLFCKRNRLSQKKMEQLEKCRRTATSDPFIIYSFYDRLQETIQQLGLQDKPSHIFNLDETGFNMDPGRIKGVAGVGQKVHRSIEGSGKENITTMACISASGVLLPPLIIYQGQNLWSTWKGSNDLEGTCYAVSDKGWMTTAVFNSWFCKFCSMVSQRPLLVIMDGHVSHLDRGTIELALKNNITLFKLPPHATDILQPLDKCCFGPLKLKWNQKLTEWQRLNQRRLTKSEFADMICELWNEGITDTIIKKSFEITGIFPCSREKYPVERLNEIKLQKYNESAHKLDPLDIYELNQNDGNDEVEANNSEQKTEEKTAHYPNETETLEGNNVEPQPSASTSFEHILLNKINKTNPEIKRRRKVNSNCAVLTSAEYLDSIKEKENLQTKKKEPKKKVTKVADSSSDDESITYQEDSDIENLTLEAVLEEEKENHAAEEFDFTTSEINIGDYVLVKFCTKKKIMHFVALVESVGDDEYSVSYLRRKGNKFIFPHIPENYEVQKEDVVLKLPPPTSHGGTARVSQQFVFSIAINKYNVN